MSVCALIVGFDAPRPPVQWLDVHNVRAPSAAHTQIYLLKQHNTPYYYGKNHQRSSSGLSRTRASW